MGDTATSPLVVLLLILLLVCLARILGDVLADAGCCSHGDIEVDPEDLRNDRRLPGLRRRVFCVPSPGIISSSLLKCPLARGAAVDAAEYEYFERGIGRRVGVIAVELRGDFDGRLRIVVFWGIVILMGSTFMGGNGADGNGGGVAKLPGNVYYRMLSIHFYGLLFFHFTLPRRRVVIVVLVGLPLLDCCSRFKLDLRVRLLLPSALPRLDPGT